MDELLTALIGYHTVTEAALCRTLRLDALDLLERIIALRRQGYQIDVWNGKVTLVSVPQSLLPGYIRSELMTRRFGGGTLIYEPVMDSTNQRLKTLASTSLLPDGSLVLCERQSNGRGRMQRVWQNPSGEGENLMCSLLVRPQMPADRLPLVTLAVAVAVAETFVEFGAQPGIKWPNDIVLGCKKCVGILCELATDPQGAACVVVGTGFNLNQLVFSEELAAKATSLRLENGREENRRLFLIRYLWQMERAMETLERDGLEGLLPGYRARSVTLGSRVRVVSATSEWEGMAEGLDAAGALLVRDDAGGLQTVWSGDVSVRGVMGYV